MKGLIRGNFNPKPIFYFIIFVGVTLIALFLINYFNISYPISVKTSQVSGELAVVGEGQVEVVPNNANVDLGVTVENATTVNAVQSELNKTNNNVIAALTKMGVPKNQIKTSNYNINPTYQYNGGPQRITGYSGTATLTVNVKDVAQLSQVISTALEAGANQVFSTQMTVDEPEKYREKARNKAIENARAQAEKLASELGIKLGKIVNIVESQPNNPGPIYYDKSIETRGGNAAPNIQPGTQTISSTVTLYFEKR